MSLERPLVLVADDDAAIVELVCTLVRADGMDAIGARDGQEALRLFADCGPDLVILDLMMPVMDGFEACEQIRHLSPGVPIVFLSAKDGESDKVVGLTLGADDYVTKPFRPRELMARIHARLRAARIQDPDRPELSVGALELDPVSHKARLLGKELQLTPTEFRLLQELLRAGSRSRWGSSLSACGMRPQTSRLKTPLWCISAACAASWSGWMLLRNTSKRSGA